MNAAAKGLVQAALGWRFGESGRLWVPFLLPALPYHGHSVAVDQSQTLCLHPFVWILPPSVFFLGFLLLAIHSG
ncbi:hypothetical protein VTO42DRAFT_1702 [Malbranchea cinnamomea]